MQIVARQFPGLALLARLNSDWIITVAAVVLGLMAGALLGSVLIGELPLQSYQP
ncbi:hypothetical protein [Pseudogemmobacter faecipullorum]|uniref:ABC transporter permease n=1 Tax=Pseudogemmobacter faecipullorum TaxID=2755041 RepID=A0ABS8CKT2_9RHOB|nr:hypothetical protein [Pseudogemmobacter faecipullorum]MCB5409770.1 hypothetical protein [Pseudogemmobacter faecipullorum]